MLLIFKMYNVTDRILPCGTPISLVTSDRDEPTGTLNWRSDRNFATKSDQCPLKLALYMSRRMLHFYVMSYAFSRSKNIVTACSRSMNAS
jgi:hypothetical protein